MKTLSLEQSIDLMGETLLEQLEKHVKDNNIDFSDAIYEEWITPDSNDPQDGDYEFIYLPNYQNI